MQSGTPSSPHPTLFLDIDDVLCLSHPYGERQVSIAVFHPGRTPTDLWERLFAAEAVCALNELMEQGQPRVVITSSWADIFDKHHFVDIFQRTGLGQVGESLHENWNTPQDAGVSRHDAVSLWLQAHHRGEPFLILDDHLSGDSLVDSMWHEAGNAVLCEVGGGFKRGLLPSAIRALKTPFIKPAWW